MTLSRVLRRLAKQTEGECVSLGDLLGAFGARVFGPMLLVPAVIAVAPTGAIPGMSILTGSLIFAVAVQLLLLRGEPTLPSILADFAFERQKLVGTIEKAIPYTERIDTLIKPRLEFAVEPPFAQLVAFVCIVMSALMFPLALLPFAVALPGTTVALLALGLTARDGLLVLIGLAFSLGVIGLSIAWWLDYV